MITGGCHCGAIRYQAEGEALVHALCHCTDCRRHAGAPMVGWWNRTVIDVPLEKVVGRSRTVDPDGALIRTARAVGICLGDVA